MPAIKSSQRALRRRGAIMPLFCILLPILVALAAFSINYANMQLIGTQAQIAADASVRGAGRTFALTGDIVAARNMARSLASRNLVGTKTLLLPDSCFTLGSSTRNSTEERFLFTPMGQQYSNSFANSLRIIVDEADQRHLLPNMFSQQTFGIDRTAISAQVEVDIALVLDRSGSMAYASDEVPSGFTLPAAAPPGWAFGHPAPPLSRWLDLVDASNSFLTFLEQSIVDEHVALATYGTTATANRILSGDYSTIREGIDVYTQSFGSGATNIEAGLSEGANLLESGRPFASKVLVLMTDGIRTAGLDPLPQATSLGKQGVIIFTVTFSDQADKLTMQSLSLAANGQHFHAASGVDLRHIFESIAKSIPTIITQ